MAFSLGVVLAVRLLEAVAVNASRSTAPAMGREASGLSRSTALAMAAKRADVRSRTVHFHFRYKSLDNVLTSLWDTALGDYS